MQGGMDTAISQNSGGLTEDVARSYLDPYLRKPETETTT